MKTFKDFKKNHINESITSYKQTIRDIIRIIPSDNLTALAEKILTMIATNNNVRNKHYNGIEKYGAPYFLDNFDNILNEMKLSYERGKLGELVVEDYLINKYGLEVIPTKTEEDISGKDLITIGKNTLYHQIKTIYNYTQIDDNTIEIYSSISIKSSDIYDYIWFLVTDWKPKRLQIKTNSTAEIISFNKKSTTITNSGKNKFTIKYNTKHAVFIPTNIIEKIGIIAEEETDKDISAQQIKEVIELAIISGKI